MQVHLHLQRAQEKDTSIIPYNIYILYRILSGLKTYASVTFLNKRLSFVDQRLEIVLAPKAAKQMVH